MSPMKKAMKAMKTKKAAGSKKAMKAIKAKKAAGSRKAMKTMKAKKEFVPRPLPDNMVLYEPYASFIREMYNSRHTLRALMH